ncbi:MAG: hypothetical protein K8F30_02380, partial [Taibaiella sp.]|nr:hypothetical protein [Taibaiella sp.]
VLNSQLNDYSDKSKRKLKYDFNDLEAVIFGIRTSMTDKIETIRIIENKCKENKITEFDFYQAYYSKKTGKVETKKLNLINFS